MTPRTAFGTPRYPWGFKNSLRDLAKPCSMNARVPFRPRLLPPRPTTAWPCVFTGASRPSVASRRPRPSTFPWPDKWKRRETRPLLGGVDVGGCSGAVAGGGLSPPSSGSWPWDNPDTRSPLRVPSLKSTRLNPRRTARPSRARLNLFHISGRAGTLRRKGDLAGEARLRGGSPGEKRQTTKDGEGDARARRLHSGLSARPSRETLPRT